VLLLEKSFFSLRARLIKASAQEVKAGRPPLIGMDEFLLIFEQAEELARADWTLARDLLCIRVLEMLHAQGYFRAHAEVLKDLGEETDDESGSPIVEEGARA
jgi:CRISPR-associated protein Cst1